MERTELGPKKVFNVTDFGKKIWHTDFTCSFWLFFFEIIHVANQMLHCETSWFVRTRCVTQVNSHRVRFKASKFSEHVIVY